MTDPTRALLNHLADGRFHSGEHLARQLHCTRTAIWKRMHALSAAGFEIDAVRGRGYRLGAPVELLDARAIRSGIPADAATAIQSVEVLVTTDSTNRRLLDREIPEGVVLLAEHQSHGSGRRGRIWESPAGAGLWLSLGWHFPVAPGSLMLLSLLSGAALIRALAGCGVAGVGLKWPNDLVLDGAKLGGILIESRGQVAGPVQVVIGVGINVRLPGSARVRIDQPAADLHGSGRAPGRNRLAAEVIGELVRMLRRAAEDRVEDYLEEWRRHDIGRGREACLSLAGEEIRGQVVDIDRSGLLIMRVNGETRHFSSGDLSLRVR
jgi:BirA family biotin operon repressor/biotin-[acetyl-CoA-carboxylase] ligase